MTTQFADLKKHLYNDAGVLRNFVNVYVGDEDIRDLDGLESEVKDGGEILIVPSIAGGNSAAEAKANDDLPTLSNEEYARYSRHLILPEVGLEGQRKLKNAACFDDRHRRFGFAARIYIWRRRASELWVWLISMSWTNRICRGRLFTARKMSGDRKSNRRRIVLKDINPNVKIEAHETRLTSENALELFKDFDVVVDGTDNFPTRYLVNDACVLTGKPNVYGSIFRFEGQVTVFDATRGACYRCLYPEPPPPGLVPSCAEGGVLGVLPGIVGTIQANEVIKVILGAEGILFNRLLLFDAWKMKFRELKLKKNPDCPICGNASDDHGID